MTDVGESVRFRSDIKDNTGALVNAASVTLTVTLPDGTSTVLSPTNPPAITGKYFHDYTPAIAGRFVGTWLFTFAGGTTASYVETFDVGGGLITVDEAVAHLRAAGILTGADDLEQLQWCCLVAAEAVELDLDRVISRRLVTEVADGGRNAIILTRSPVVSVTSIVESGLTLAPADYRVDLASGIIKRGGTYPLAFGYGYGTVAVTYVAGYLDPPRVVRAVALNIVQGLWQSSQQASHPLLDDATGEIYGAVAALDPRLQSAYDSLRRAAVA